MLLYTADTRGTLMHLVYKHSLERAGFNMYAENTQQQLTFLTLLPEVVDSFKNLSKFANSVNPTVYVGWSVMDPMI